MSKTIDERVVEMRFDNKHFESNVATSMSTLEKLKQKLNFSGASKGLEDINTASKKIDMTGLSGAVESVKLNFSALDVVAVTALANIANSAVNAGKQLVKSLSVDQLSAGWQKFSDKTTSVATLVAQGNAIEDVNDQLDRLNWFTDETSYNFTEMVSNIAKFTATGKGLNESVTAMEGIATWAALSGQNAATASRAMYQLSQAMGAGVMRLEDYKSIQNASMDTEEFRQKCLDAGVALGTLKENSDGTYSSLVDGASGASFGISQFATNLTKEMWLTSDVMMKVFNDYSSAVEGIYNAAEEKGMLASEIIDEIYTTAEQKGISTDEAIKSLGYDFDSFALKAFEAAQKARTFNDAIDSIKDAVSTGWMKTFELIFGDAEKATELWTDLANTLYDVFAAGGETRNTILEFALNFAKPWETISEKLKSIQGITDKVKNVTKVIGDASDKLEHFQSVADKIWNGDFNNVGDNPDRFDLLTKAGYDPRVVQDLVNKGYQYKLTVEDIEAAHKKFGLTMETTTKETKKTMVTLNEASSSYARLSDEQLKQAGLTEEEISLYRALEKEASRLGISISDLAKEMSENDGRTLLIDSFKNFGNAILETGEAIKKAWSEIFDIPSIGEIAVKLYGVIKSLNDFSKKLTLIDKDTGEFNETGKKIIRTFKGLFAVVDMVATVLGGGLKIAFELISQVLGYFNLDILDVTANIGDALVAFHDWFDSIFDISGILDTIVPHIQKAVDAIKEWYTAFKQTPAVQEFVAAIEAIRSAFDKLTNGKINLSEFAMSLGENLARALKSLPGIALQIGKDFIAGFSDGIGFSVSGVIDKIVSFCLNFIEGFKEALGVHSPSWKAFEIAKDFFQGFINGAKEGIRAIIPVLKKIGGKIVDVFKGLWDFITDESGNIEWGKVFAGGAIVGMILVLKKLATAFNGVADVFGGIGDLLSSAAGTLRSFSKVLSGIAWDLKAKAILKMAIAVGILVAAIWVLTKIDDPSKIWEAVGVITVLAAVLVGLAIAMDKLGSASIDLDAKSKKLNVKGIQNSIIQIGIALLLIAVAAKIIGGMDVEEAAQGFIGLAGVAVGMVVFMAAIGGISRYAKDVDGIGSMMKKMAVAIILMVVACKLVGMLSAEDMLKGAAFAAAFAIFVIAITKVAKSAGNNVSKVGGMVIKLTIAMALMVGVCKLVGMLSVEDMLKGAAFAAAFVLFVKALVNSTKIGKKQQIAKLSGLVLSISISLLMMVGVCKLVGQLSVSEMIKGAVFVAGFVVLLKTLVSILKIGNEEQMAKVTGTILAMSVAIAILAAVAVLLSFMDLGGLAKGIVAVGLLSTMMTIMVKSLKGAQDVKGSILMMAIAIGIMAASIAALSFIDTKSLISAAGAMTIVMSAFALMAKSMSSIKNVKIGPLIALVGVVVILAGIIVVLSEIEPSSAISSVASLALLMLSMAAVLKILNTISGSVKNSLKGVLALTAMVVPLMAFAAVLAVMSGTENAMDNVLALSLLMTAMTVLLAAVSLVGKYLSSGIIVGVASLTAMAVPMWVFIQVLKEMDDIEDATEKVKSLVTMMTAMTLLLAVLAVVGLGGPAAIIGIGSLVALFVAIGALAVGIGALMEEFPSIQKFLDTGLPVLEQLAGSIGTMIGEFIGSIGEALGDSLVKIGEDIAAFMEQLAIASDNASGVKGESFNGVKELIGVLGDIALTTVGTSISDVFTLGGTSMEKFQTDGVAFFNAMKAIGEASSGVNIDEKSMNSVIGIAQKLAKLQSSLEPIGGVITWFTGRDDLSAFGDNIVDFIEAMKMAFSSLDGITLNTDAMESIVTAASKLVKLQSSLEPIGGVITWFTGRDDLGIFGVNVGEFIGSMKTAFETLDGVALNEEALTSVITAASKLAELQSSLEPIGGVITWFTGRDDLGTFGVNVGEFIGSMKTALTTLDDTTLNEESLASIIMAASKLAELQSSLESIGGVITWFTGRDDLGTFGINISEFIGSMKTALTTLGDTTLNEEALTSVITATSKLAELQSSLEPMGGVVSWFTGKNDLGTFGTNIGLFADAMGTFGSKAAEIDSTAVSTVISTAYRIKSLIESLVDLDDSGLKTFTGVGIGGFRVGGAAREIAQTIADFSDKVADINTEAVTTSVSTAQKLKTLIASLTGLDTSGIENFKPQSIGSAMKDYAGKVASIDTEVVASSITSANRLKNFIANLANLDTSGIGNFKVSSIGTSLKSYSSSVSSMDITAVSASITAANRLKNFIASLANLNSSGVGSFKSAIDELSTVSISDLVKAFSGASAQLNSAGADMINGLIKGMQSKLPAAKSAIVSLLSSMVNAVKAKSSTFKNAGEAIMARLQSGISGKSSSVASALTSCLVKASDSIRGYYNSFYSAGSYLVTGFANGISDNAYKAAAKAKAMAEAASEAAREALGINSPSKVFKKIGSGIPEGFAMGIGMLGGKVNSAVDSMASFAINTTRSAMTTVLDALNGDMDFQPTIRPVVDLSNVQTGADAINGLFNSAQTVGVRSNLNAIGYTMNTMHQNGRNDDVISAINKLRDKLDGVGNTYNTVNGVTYDDGSNVADAVETLIRYAKIGRRV